MRFTTFTNSSLVPNQSISPSPGPILPSSSSGGSSSLATATSTFTQQPITSTVQPSSLSVSSSTTSDAFTSSSPSPQLSSSSQSPTSVVLSVITQGSSSGNAAATTTVLVTSIQSTSVTPANTASSKSTLHSSTSTSSNAAALATSGSDSKSSGGLSAPGRIAVAVVVPVAAVALIVLALLFWWRKRKQRKDAEELRRKEVEDYGFNPNNDPTLPVVGGASSNGDETSEMREMDGAGYRGWGTTSTNRKASTTLSSGNGGIGIARSGSGSDPGGYHGSSPTANTAQNSDVQSGDPLVGSPQHDRPMSGDSETIGALGAAPPANGNRNDIHRGASNASSAYSGAHRSDTSGEGGLSGASHGQQLYNDDFYTEGMPSHGPYGDGSYGGGAPVIKDVSARRNTRIESPTVFPQQGNAGISQNF